MKRRLLVAGTLLASLFLLAGCGGAAAPAAGDTTAAAGAAADAPGAAAAAAAAAPTTDPATGALVGDGTAAPAATPPVAEVLSPGDQIKTSEATPKAFIDAKCKQVIVFYAYQPGADADERMLKEVHTAVDANKGVQLMTYTPAQYKEFGDLPENLGILRPASSGDREQGRQAAKRPLGVLARHAHRCLDQGGVEHHGQRL